MTSSAAQLSLLGAPPAPDSAVAAKAEARPICACGHELARHDAKGCAHGRGTKFGGCPCKKHREKGVKPTLEKPFGALTLMRPDTKRPKVMGWATVTDAAITIWLDRIRTMSTNTERGMFFSAVRGRKGGDEAAAAAARKKAMGTMMGISTLNKAQRDRALSALEQAGVLNRARHMPTSVTVRRVVCGGGLDGHDNLSGALKHVVDGVAEGLIFDDKHFNKPGSPVLVIDQRSPGKRGVYGVEIVLEFGKAAT